VDPRTDAELLRALRAGDIQAYDTLWQRHSSAALRHAYRFLPARAEDLVSEAFLAVFQQVTTTDSGPQFAFRSYLKSVLRNLAIRWRKEAEQLVDLSDVDQIDERDALSIAQSDDDASAVLAALQTLPDRWQQVLWLAEVVEAGRSEIARELGIKPNAVSQLQRRARAGLKLQWLSGQIPPPLRDDPAHVARLLPRHLAGPRDAVLAAEVDDHIATCVECRSLLATLCVPDADGSRSPAPPALRNLIR